MSVSSTAYEKTFTGNGTATAFPFPFYTPDAKYLTVTLNGTVITTGFTIALNSDQSTNPGGTLTYNGTVLTSADTLVIERVLPKTQDTQIASASGFYPKVIEKALDWLTMLVQQAGTTAVLDYTAMPAASSPVPDTALVPLDVGGNNEGGTLSQLLAGASKTIGTLANLNAFVPDHDGQVIYFRDTQTSGATGGRAGAGTCYLPGGTYTAAQLQAFITSDPQGGIWQPVNGDATGASGAVKRIVSGVFDPRWFGAVTGISNNVQTAVQACVNYCINYGHNLHFYAEDAAPTIYRTTGRIDVGEQTIKIADILTDGPAPTISSAVNANKNYSNIVIDADPGVVLWGDFDPSGTSTPILAYWLDSPVPSTNEHSTGGVRDIHIAGQSSIVNGAFVDTNSDPAPTTGQVGLITTRGAAISGNITVTDCQYGWIGNSNYWADYGKAHARHCGLCWSQLNFNAGSSDQVVCWYSDKGVQVSGGSFDLAGVHTEEVLDDLIVPSCDSSSIGPSYLEDASTSDGTGHYAVTFGSSENGLQINESSFTCLRVNPVRPNKKAFRMWSVTSANFISCRQYSNGIDSDANSHGTIINCEEGWLSQLTANGSSQVNWNVLDIGGIIPAKIVGSISNTGFSEPKSALLNVTSATIAANSNVVQSFTVTGAQTGDFVIVTPVSGMNQQIGISNARVTAADTVQVSFNNITTSPASIGGEIIILCLKRV